MQNLSERYCRFAGKRKYVCPYEPEERKSDFCLVCRVTKLVNQQDLIIKQNKAVVTILNQARDLLGEIRDILSKEKERPT